ncbi:DnaD domain protein [Marinicrinis lubricantis]|uniref:DnaD domain protein n=1 Tax=Marinicrinis lubricantis TaxID=2086470 RepID=A0ABW1IM05_9BACL
MSYQPAYIQGLLDGFLKGTVSVPYFLLQHYAKLNLNETEMLLILQLYAFQDKENKDFPTPDEIKARMHAPLELVIKSLQRLIKEQYIQIDDGVDPLTGVQYEKYNLRPLFERMARLYADHAQGDHASAVSHTETGDRGNETVQRVDSIYKIFEQEFGRPLSPMELETISQWLDRDSYSEPLILAALKEAVFSGKVHFRYIDRILLEWSRNRITTPEQAKEYVQKFRGR